eukprot:4633632-Amphidinium_carterae.2
MLRKEDLSVLPQAFRLQYRGGKCDKLHLIIYGRCVVDQRSRLTVRSGATGSECQARHHQTRLENHPLNCVRIVRFWIEEAGGTDPPPSRAPTEDNASLRGRSHDVRGCWVRIPSGTRHAVEHSGPESRRSLVLFNPKGWQGIPVDITA